jgi:deazaflavin-dependent oxidoreductase (nitroreductase family)
VPGLSLTTSARVRLRRRAIKTIGRAHLAVYRATRGRLLGSVAGMPVLLLTTTGRRSGKQRTTPLTFFRDGDAIVLIASNGGDERPPAWWLNLQHSPRATVQIGAGRAAVTAANAPEQARARLWTEITATYQGYAAYQRRTTRQIPVVLLTPVEPGR